MACGTPESVRVWTVTCFFLMDFCLLLLEIIIIGITMYLFAASSGWYSMSVGTAFQLLEVIYSKLSWSENITVIAAQPLWFGLILR